MNNLFPRLLGDSFDALPTPVRTLHERALPSRFEGRASVFAAQNPLAYALARLLGFPPACIDAPISVLIEPSDSGEVWTRSFPPRPMRSRLYAKNGQLHERLGPVDLGFVLQGDAAGIEWRVVSLSVLGLPLPAAWLSGVKAREFALDGRYCFSISASLPLLGRLIAYEGWLHVE